MVPLEKKEATDVKILKRIVTKLPISPEMTLAICLYKLIRGDYY